MLSFGFRDLKSSKLELQYLDEDGGISASVGLLGNPIMRYSGLMGTKARSIGSDISFDTNTGSCTNYSVGFSFSKEGSIATLTLNDKDDGSGGTLSGSYYRSVKSLTNTHIGAEINLSFSTNKSTFMVGAEHVLDPLTTVKARVNSSGVASALIQHKLLPNIHFTLSGEADTKAPFNSATFDLVLGCYVEELLMRAHMKNCNPFRTPVDADSRLGPNGDPVLDPTLYRILVGALQYLTFTRPDIVYVVQQVYPYIHDPREPHFSTLERILHCRSISGYCVFLGDNLLSWYAKRQATLRLSVKAEYRGVANIVAETTWIRNLFCELHAHVFTTTLVTDPVTLWLYILLLLMTSQLDVVDVCKINTNHTPRRLYKYSRERKK
nr:mitochondrial outer membrane protein porin of 34 kDa-like [Tanacetum cinerariifolium]